MKRIVVTICLLLFSSIALASEDSMHKQAIFAGGCFWCVEKPFDELYGVEEVVPGYTGGSVAKPSYKEVSSGNTGHREAVRISYDSNKISYKDLLDLFLKQIDLSDGEGQFGDRGFQYSPAIYYGDHEQHEIAQKAIYELAKKIDVQVELVEATDFYIAEKYHHKYYKKNPDHYKKYYKFSGRGPYLDKKWKGYQKKIKLYVPEIDKDVYLPKIYKTKEEWRKILDSDVFHITTEKGTERAGSGELLDNKKDGVYKCVRCNNALFASKDKYDSGTGWPSFTLPISEHNINLEDDNTLFMKRVEVLCARCGAHLGHVFDDGPKPSGKRYCINSLSLRFKEHSTKEGL